MNSNDEIIAKLTDVNAKLAQFNLDEDYQKLILS